jgi:hypothetical protein
MKIEHKSLDINYKESNQFRIILSNPFNSSTSVIIKFCKNFPIKI